MKNVIKILLISVALVSCGSNASRRIASIPPASSKVKSKPKAVSKLVVAAKADPTIIELDSPLKEGLNAEVLGYKEAKSQHTVYDDYANAEKYKKKSTAQLVQLMAGPYRFYLVKKDETLNSIAQKIYGSEDKAKYLQSWNYELIPTEEDLRPGMKLKYLPKPNRMPASK